MQSLKELGEEYVQSAGNISFMIASCNEKMRDARKRGDAEEIYRLRTNLRDLYAQRAHLREIAHILKNYYICPRSRIH